MLGLTPPTDTDLYLTPRPEGEDKLLPVPKFSRFFDEPPQSDNTDGLLSSNKTKFLYHVKKLTGVYYLYIPP